jgi:light-regulated signal transduction histidine kinase (bacteriophytochrome)
MADDELTALRARVEHLESALAAASSEAARAAQDGQQLAYVVSHDLQEPVRMVASYCQLLQRRYGDKLDDAAKEYIHFATDGASRLSAMIRDLLVYSRIYTRGRPFAPCDSNAVLGVARGNVRAAVDAAGATIEVGTLPHVTGDGDQLSRAFEALLDNAVKFRRPGATPVVKLSAEKIPDATRFICMDDGIGFDPQQKHRLFGVFQRLVTRAEYPGNGIGLALVRRIAERHGGLCGAEPGAGGGATFWFTVSDHPPAR